VIRPGYYFRVYTLGSVPNCHHMIASGSVRFEAKGSYVIKLWGMWFDVERRVWVYYSDEEITKYVTVQVSWPHTVPIHIFINKKLKAESWELGKSATESIINIDTSLLQGGKLDYTVQYIQGTPLAEIAKIWFDGEKIVEERLSKGEAKSGTIDLTGLIGRTATITISFDSMFGFWSEVLFDVWLVLGFSEEPPTPPEPEPFDWMEWLRKNAWWISLGVLGAGLIIMSRSGTPIVIYQPPRQKGEK